MGGFLKYKKVPLPKTFKIFSGFFWENIIKAFFWENIRTFLILELGSSISKNKWNFFSGWIFFYFLSLGWEMLQVALNITTGNPLLPSHCFALLKVLTNRSSKICGRQPLKIWSDMVCFKQIRSLRFFKAVLHKICLVHSWIFCFR